MDLRSFFYLIPYFLSVAISAGVGVFAWQHRKVSGAILFAVFAWIQSLMTLGFIFELTSPSLETKVFWDNVQFIGVYFSPIFFLAFTLDYTGRKLKTPKLVWGILSLAPIIFVILMLTDHLHGMIRPETWLVPGDPFPAMVYDFTPAVWGISIFSYSLFLVGFWALVTRFFQLSRFYRYQIGVIILGVLIPLGGTLFTIFGLTPTFHRDITPFTIALGNLLIAWGLFRFQLFNLVPIARDTVFSILTDSIIVIDTQSRVIDINPAAKAHLGLPTSEVIGKPIREVYSAYHNLFDLFEGAPELNKEFSIDGDDHNKRFFSMNITRLQDHRDRLVGRVMVVRDITERKQAEEAIRKYQEDLEEIVEARTAGLMAVNESLKQEIIERQRIEESLRKTQQQFQDMFDNSLAVFYAKSMDGKYIFVNKEWRERTGFGDQDFTDKTTRDIFPEHQRDVWDEQEKQVLATGEAITVEVVGKTTGRTYLAIKFLLRDANGTPYALCNSSIDISERVRAEKALQQYVKRLEALRKIDKAIIAAESPETIAQKALDHIQRVIPCKHISIITFDTETNLIKILASTDQDEQIRAMLINSTLPESNKKDFQPDEIFFVHNLQNASQLTPVEQLLLERGILAYVRIPLIFQSSVIGSIKIGMETQNELLSEIIEITQEIADQLAIAIQQARLNEQIRYHADQLEQRIAERTAELEAANQDLQALSRVKDEFVSNVSHELRTPITNLKLYHDLLPLKPEKQDQYLETIWRETNRLEILIEDLLTISRLDQRRINLTLARYDLNTFIDTYIKDHSLLAGQKEITLKFIPEPKLPFVNADENLIGQILSILVTNALNYTPRGGEVTVLTEIKQSDEQNWGGFCVQDTGPGIPIKDQEQLFTRFYRGKVGLESGIPGTGLGLSIANEIIKCHEGYIEVESEGLLEKGTKFRVWLPL